MPLPDERPRGSVANLIGKFEQQSKRASDAAGSVVERVVPLGSLRHSLAGRPKEEKEGKEEGKGLLGLLGKKEEVKKDEKPEESKPEVKEQPVVEPAKPAKPAEPAASDPPAPVRPPEAPPQPSVSDITDLTLADLEPPTKPPKTSVPPVPPIPSHPTASTAKNPKTPPTSRSAVGSTRTPASASSVRSKTPTARHPPSTSASASVTRTKSSALSSSTSTSSQASKLARPASRARTPASPSPSLSHSRSPSSHPHPPLPPYPVSGLSTTTPRSSALSAPTASSLAKARTPPTKSPTIHTVVLTGGGNPAVRRQSVNELKDTTPTKPGNGGQAKRGTPSSLPRGTARGTGTTRGTPTRGRGAALASSTSKRLAPEQGESLRSIPGGAEPPADHPGGDEPTSEAVAQRELELIQAHVPPLRSGVNGLGEGEGVHGKGAKERLAEVVPPASEVEGGEESTLGGEVAQEPEEIAPSREGDESHPEMHTPALPLDHPQQQEPEELDAQDEEAPPKEVLDSVQLEGIDSVDAEGIAHPDEEVQRRMHLLHEGEEGVGAIPDEE